MTQRTGTLVTFAALAAVLAGGLMSAGAAAATPTERQAAPVSEDATARSVNNLGLSTAQARGIQCFLRDSYNYTGALDGLLGPQSWRAMQRHLQRFGYNDAIDGIVGPNTIRALQRQLRYWGYRDGADGIAGPNTQAAFKRWGDHEAARC
ncbi:peptidoglycan-binding domain-containing protein [Streptomyces bohaiensis]|uniref:peptidoglycan-binding domain-containing protein n=1 Tax=Streptomyces bohaiensis TaxID=1431344 RepID=UPI003B767AEC